MATAAFARALKLDGLPQERFGLDDSQWALFCENAHMVVQIAYRFSPNHRDDLKQEGYMALARAAQQCSPEQKDSFTGYARFKIKGAMIDHLRGPADSLGATWRSRAKREEAVLSLDMPSADGSAQLREIIPGQELRPDQIAILSEVVCKIMEGELLSGREKEYLGLLLQGFEGSEISQQMKVGRAQVSRLRGNVLRAAQQLLQLPKKNKTASGSGPGLSSGFS